MRQNYSTFKSKGIQIGEYSKAINLKHLILPNVWCTFVEKMWWAKTSKT